MAVSPLETGVRTQAEAGVIDLRGDITGAAEAAMTQAFDECIKSDPSSIILNFTEVGYINSTGIALIVALLARARRDHRNITAYGLAEHYKEIFQITRLADFMGIYDDEDSALKDSGGAGGQEAK